MKAEGVKFSKYFGEALAERRKSARLSSQALSEVLAVDRTTVWRWETGQYWPQDPNEVAAVYSREAKDDSPLDLWKDALARAQEADAAGELERFLTADRPSAEDLDVADAQQADSGLSQVDDGPASD